MQQREEEDGHCSSFESTPIFSDSGNLRPPNWRRRVLGISGNFSPAKLELFQGNAASYG
ncbi:hypothetical protein RchiOBHm_Chr1g0331641 [Rosa chinensis]|uniref:Uncharacterized protein n=1 Tax=Rosa chinensis TaxID=74649 RepID=A0A2P6SBM0_ROSCH|nr:hypothetical protein RchiOBHm_Chr1g0331641 [Rosa chinensis]